MMAKLYVGDIISQICYLRPNHNIEFFKFPFSKTLRYNISTGQERKKFVQLCIVHIMHSNAWNQELAVLLQ